MKQKSILAHIIQSKKAIKMIGFAYALFFLFFTGFYFFSLGGVYLTANVQLSAEDARSSGFNLEIPTLAASNHSTFVHATHEFSIVVLWREVLNEPNLWAYLCLRILPYLLFIIQFYVLYRIVEKMENEDFFNERLFRFSKIFITLSIFYQLYGSSLADSFKIAFLQKHIYFKDASWINSALMHNDFGNPATISILFFISILSIIYLKGEELKKENDLTI
jgi:Protein of unknown function (DUF2975)